MSLRAAGSEGGWWLALAAGAVFLAVGLAVVWATKPAPIAVSRPQLVLPAFPVDLQDAADIACRAEKVLKNKSISAGGGYWTYTAEHTNPDGGSVFLRWTDVPGLDAKLAVQINGGATAVLDIGMKTAACLRQRAVKTAGSLE